MKAASTAGYLSLVLLAVFLVGCSDGDAEQPVVKLTEASEETSTSAASSEAEGSSPDSPGKETPSQAAQRVVDQAASVDVKEAYTRGLQAVRSAGVSCEPTPPDMLGPFYVPDAPVRTSVDSGYVLSGNVLSADGCEPIPGAQIEFWLANPEGVYDDAHRATIMAGEQGAYQFASNVPVPYEGRPPHIHVRATALGFQDLVTQHYPEVGQTEATFDLVLEPA